MNPFRAVSERSEAAAYELPPHRNILQPRSMLHYEPLSWTTGQQPFDSLPRFTTLTCIPGVIYYNDVWGLRCDHFHLFSPWSVQWNPGANPVAGPARIDCGFETWAMSGPQWCRLIEAEWLEVPQQGKVVEDKLLSLRSNLVCDADEWWNAARLDTVFIYVYLQGVTYKVS